MLTREDIENDDVVALYISGDIYIGPAAVKKALEHGTVDGYILRHIFKFMVEMDLDPRWAEYAEYPTLFTMTDYNAWTRGEPIGQTKSQPSGDDSASQR